MARRGSALAGVGSDGMSPQEAIDRVAWDRAAALDTAAVRVAVVLASTTDRGTCRGYQRQLGLPGEACKYGESCRFDHFFKPLSAAADLAAHASACAAPDAVSIVRTLPFAEFLQLQATEALHSSQVLSLWLRERRIWSAHGRHRELWAARAAEPRAPLAPAPPTRREMLPVGVAAALDALPGSALDCIADYAGPRCWALLARTSPALHEALSEPLAAWTRLRRLPGFAAALATGRCGQPRRPDAAPAPAPPPPPPPPVTDRAQPRGIVTLPGPRGARSGAAATAGLLGAITATRSMPPALNSFARRSEAHAFDGLHAAPAPAPAAARAHAAPPPPPPPPLTAHAAAVSLARVTDWGLALRLAAELALLLATGVGKLGEPCPAAPTVPAGPPRRHPLLPLGDGDLLHDVALQLPDELLADAAAAASASSLPGLATSSSSSSSSSSSRRRESPTTTATSSRFPAGGGLGAPLVVSPGRGASAAASPLQPPRSPQLSPSASSSSSAPPGGPLAGQTHAAAATAYPHAAASSSSGGRPPLSPALQPRQPPLVSPSSSRPPSGGRSQPTSPAASAPSFSSSLMMARAMPHLSLHERAVAEALERAWGCESRPPAAAAAAAAAARGAGGGGDDEPPPPPPAVAGGAKAGGRRRMSGGGGGGSAGGSGGGGGGGAGGRAAAATDEVVTHSLARALQLLVPPPVASGAAELDGDVAQQLSVLLRLTCRGGVPPTAAATAAETLVDLLSPGGGASELDSSGGGGGGGGAAAAALLRCAPRVAHGPRHHLPAVPTASPAYVAAAPLHLLAPTTATPKPGGGEGATTAPASGGGCLAATVGLATSLGGVRGGLVIPASCGGLTTQVRLLAVGGDSDGGSLASVDVDGTLRVHTADGARLAAGRVSGASGGARGGGAAVARCCGSVCSLSYCASTATVATGHPDGSAVVTVFTGQATRLATSFRAGAGAEGGGGGKAGAAHFYSGGRCHTLVTLLEHGSQLLVARDAAQLAPMGRPAAAASAPPPPALVLHSLDTQDVVRVLLDQPTGGGGPSGGAASALLFDPPPAPTSLTPLGPSAVVVGYSTGLLRVWDVRTAGGPVMSAQAHTGGGGGGGGATADWPVQHLSAHGPCVLESRHSHRGGVAGPLVRAWDLRASTSEPFHAIDLGATALRRIAGLYADGSRVLIAHSHAPLLSRARARYERRAQRGAHFHWNAPARAAARRRGAAAVGAVGGGGVAEDDRAGDPAALAAAVGARAPGGGVDGARATDDDPHVPDSLWEQLHYRSHVDVRLVPDYAWSPRDGPPPPAQRAAAESARWGGAAAGRRGVGGGGVGGGGVGGGGGSGAAQPVAGVARSHHRGGGGGDGSEGDGPGVEDDDEEEEEEEQEEEPRVVAAHGREMHGLSVWHPHTLHMAAWVPLPSALALAAGAGTLAVGTDAGVVLWHTTKGRVSPSAASSGGRGGALDTSSGWASGGDASEAEEEEEEVAAESALSPGGGGGGGKKQRHWLRQQAGAKDRTMHQRQRRGDAGGGGSGGGGGGGGGSVGGGGSPGGGAKQPQREKKGGAYGRRALRYDPRDEHALDQLRGAQLQLQQEAPSGGGGGGRRRRALSRTSGGDTSGDGGGGGTSGVDTDGGGGVE